MKLELETIPVWDGVNSGSECYICDLMKEAQGDAIAFHLGNSVMNPETRVRVNEHGFCSSHWGMLVQANRPQGVALMGDTYLQMSRKKMEQSIQDLLKVRGSRAAKRAVENFERVLESREQGCLVCTLMEARLRRYLFTTAYLWEKDGEFRAALGQSKGFCLHHFSLLLQEGKEATSTALYDEFVREMTSLEVRNLDRIGEDLHWMTQMYKSENSGKDWRGCEDAHKRGVYKMSGRYRVIDPL